MEISIMLFLTYAMYLMLVFMIIMVTYIGYKTLAMIPYLQTRRDKVYVSMILGLMVYGLYKATSLLIKISSVIMEG